MGQLQQTVKQRYHLIDAVRGIAIICMVIYHGAWDLECLFGVDISWFGAQSGRIFQRLIRWSFILLSGWAILDTGLWKNTAGFPACAQFAVNRCSGWENTPWKST